MIKLCQNLFLLQMIKKKNLVFLLIFVLLNNCSFDDKTGIWSGSEEEKRKISQLEKEQKKITDIEKLFSSENIYEIFFGGITSLPQVLELSQVRQSVQLWSKLESTTF